MASVGNTVTRTASLKVRLRTQPRTTAPTQSWIKRCVVNCARKLHDLPYTFPLLTRAFRMLQGAGLNVSQTTSIGQYRTLRNWKNATGRSIRLRRHVGLS